MMGDQPSVTEMLNHIEAAIAQTSVDVRILFIPVDKSHIIEVYAERLEDYLNDGFEIVTEEFRDGVVYIRLERENSGAE